VDELRRGVLDREVGELPGVVDLNARLMGELMSWS
jgi:hypothetical protein